jgi:hypothetical protein
MVRASIAVLAAACTAISSAALAQTTPNPSQPNQTVAGPPPMRFEWMREGPAEKCGTQCREWISATGAIVDTTVMDFEAFAQTRDVRGATVALDSPGGSVVQGLALGREFRRLEIVTTVGQSVRIGAESDQRATLSPNATCNSMCVYVLLGGVQRNVPEEARVLVHQIWPASKRNDANAATYSAANVVAIQRVSGELGRYIVDMGADIELFEISSRIPPWEEMRSLTREELRRLRIHTIDDPFGKPPMVRAAAPPGKKADFAMVSLNPLGWTIVERRGLRALVRQHPITIEGQEIGAFEIAFSCSDKPDIFRVSYAGKALRAKHRRRLRRQGGGGGNFRAAGKQLLPHTADDGRFGPDQRGDGAHLPRTRHDCGFTAGNGGCHGGGRRHGLGKPARDDRGDHDDRQGADRDPDRPDRACRRLARADHELLRSAAALKSIRR